MLDFCLWQDADTRAVGGMLDFCLLQYADTNAVGNLMFVLRRSSTCAVCDMLILLSFAMC